jgi:hypothetical protein
VSRSVPVRGPQCLVEDPSDQFIYSADFNDSSVTGRVVDPNSGVLNNLRVTSTYPVQGRRPGAWLTDVPADAFFLPSATGNSSNRGAISSEIAAL